MCLRNPVKVKVVQSCPTLCSPMEYTVYGILQARILEWVRHSLLQGIFPTQGSELRSPTLQADSLPAEPQGKPKELLSVYYEWFRGCVVRWEAEEIDDYYSL